MQYCSTFFEISSVLELVGVFSVFQEGMAWSRRQRLSDFKPLVAQRGAFPRHATGLTALSKCYAWISGCGVE